MRTNGLASQSYEQILNIQSLDLAVRQLRHRIDAHPARQRMAELDEDLAGHDASAAEVEQAKRELEKRQKRIEDEVALVADKRRDIDGKLYGGEITASKELLALQAEADSLLKRQTEMEDDDLVIMEELEDLDGKLAVMAEARASIEQERTASDQELQAAVAEIEVEIATVSADRESSAGSANAELLERYEALREQFGGVAVARLVGSSCDGCHMQLSAVAVDQIGKMPEDAVVTCEECGRLLVR